MKINKEQLMRVLDNWNIGNLKYYKISEKGEVNHNWLVQTDKKKFFLRRFSGSHSLRDLKFEIDYLKKLQKNGFRYRTPNPIATIRGKFLVKFNGKYFWLDTFIEGKIKNKFSKNELKNVAKMISDYHNILEKLRLRNSKSKNNDFSRKSILSEMRGFIRKLKRSQNLSGEEKIYLNETQKLIPILQNLNIKEYSKLKKYAIHRDLNPENILWKNNKILGILDFENVSQGNDSFIKDICIVIQYACSDRNHQLDFNKARFFISKYRSYRKITKKEIELIPDIMAAGFIEDFEYQYWKLVYDEERATPYRLRLYSGVAQWYFENKEMIVERLN